MNFRQRVHDVVDKLPPSAQRHLKNLARIRSDRARAETVRSLVCVAAMESPPCAICGGRRVARHTHQNGFTIVRCVNDGLLFVSPRPVDLAPFYEESYYNGDYGYQEYSTHAADLQSLWDERLKRLEIEGATVGNLLDVGCATGEFLVQARSRGWNVSGIELSEWAVRTAQKQHELSVFQGSLPNAQIPSGGCDAVTLFDCIEHLSDPRAVLLDIGRVLKPGGLLMLSTGALPHQDPRLISHWYSPPWHLYYFSEPTIRVLLEKCGFELVSYREENQHEPQHAVMVVVARRGK